jgi:hypothetical protein
MCPSAPSRVAVTVAAIEDKFLAAMGERRGTAAADQLCESCVTLLGMSLTGPDGLLKQLTKTVLETALNEEMTST